MSAAAAQLQKAVIEGGVSLAWLHQFAEQVPAGASTREVVENIIKPATAAERCRYLDKVGASHLGKPRYFVCHAWSDNFRKAVERLYARLIDPDKTSQLEEPGRSTFVWMDIFALSQHPGMAPSRLAESVDTLVNMADATVLLVDAEGLCFNRLWVLFEVWRTLKLRTHLALRVLADESSPGSLRAMFRGLDVKHAACLVEKDRERLMACIKAQSGGQPQGVSAMVREGVVAALLHEASGASNLLRSALGEAQVQERIGRCLARLGAFKDADGLLAKAQSTYRQALGSSWDPLHSTSLLLLQSQMALEQQRLGQAAQLARQALSTRQQRLGEAHPETAVAMGRVAQVLHRQGNVTAAERLYKEAFLALQDTLESEHKDEPDQWHAETALVHCNMATAVHDAGRLGEAEVLYNRSLVALRHSLGMHTPEYCQVLANLVALLHRAARGGPSGAPPGARASATGGGLGGKGGGGGARGKELQLEVAYHHALTIATTGFGEAHPHTATCMSNLGGLLFQHGKLDEAEGYFRRALRARERSLGPGHPEVASSLHHLGALQRHRGRMAEAEALLRQAVGASERAYGKEHPATGQMLNQLAVVVHQRGRTEEAEPIMRRALSIAERKAGEEHPDTARSLLNLAHIMQDTSMGYKAEPMFRRALAIFEKDLGVNHPDTALCLSKYARFLHSSGKLTEAEAMFRRALTSLEASLGRAHAEYALCVSSLASLMQQISRPEAAEPLYRQALHICTKAQVKDTQATVKCVNNLASLLLITGGSSEGAAKLAEGKQRLHEAEKLCRQAYATCKAVLGESHPETQVTQRKLVESSVAIAKANFTMGTWKQRGPKG